jgi:hypothetical protein
MERCDKAGVDKIGRNLSDASQRWDRNVAAGEFALTHRRRLMAPISTELSRHTSFTF